MDYAYVDDPFLVSAPKLASCVRIIRRNGKKTSVMFAPFGETYDLEAQRSRPEGSNEGKSEAEHGVAANDVFAGAHQPRSLLFVR